MTASHRVLRVSGPLTAFFCALALLFAAAGLAEDGEDKKKNGGAEPEKVKAAPKADPEKGEDRDGPSRSVEEEYVRENIGSYLHATKLKFLDDGRVKMEFDLTAKSVDHEEIFTSRIKPGSDSAMRWTLTREERWKYEKDGDRKPEVVGLRIANSGTAFLICWFSGELEVELDYAQAVTFSRGQTMAVVFGRDRGELVGNNCGTQCIAHRKGKPTQSVGTAEPLVFQTPTELKLVVKDGVFEAHRNKRLTQKSTYSRKDLESGRVGFLWAGGVAGVITQLEVTGRIDYKKMAGEIRNAPGR